MAEKYDNHTFIIPVHPNPNVRGKICKELSEHSNIALLEPLDYPNLVFLMKNSKLILTDSGGIQEEAPTFGCPVIVMRYETERKEGIKAGVSKLVGADFNRIISESEKILSFAKEQSRLSVKNPYGNGKSAELYDWDYTWEDKHLAHHGIKGMKWGIRRTPEQLGHFKRAKFKPKSTWSNFDEYE